MVELLFYTKISYAIQLFQVSNYLLFFHSLILLVFLACVFINNEDWWRKLHIHGFWVGSWPAPDNWSFRSFICQGLVETTWSCMLFTKSTIHEDWRANKKSQLIVLRGFLAGSHYIADLLLILLMWHLVLVENLIRNSVVQQQLSSTEYISFPLAKNIR